MNKKSKKRLLSLLLLFIFMVSVPSLFTSNYNNFDSDINLETSGTNYLFNGKEYNITLDDVYDDVDPYKIYTGANFSYVFLENDTVTFEEEVSPVNNSERYSTSPSGHFPATYSFTDEVDGTSGSDINFIASSSLDTCEIVFEDANHKKVLFIGDTGTSRATSQIFTNQVSGTIEFWARLDSGTRFQVVFVGSTTAVQIMFYGNQVRFYYGNGAGGDANTNVVVDSNYYAHIRIDFDCGTDTYDGYCNEILIVEDVNFYRDNDVSYINYLLLSINTANSYGYIDAIGYFWDVNYNVRDNFNNPPVSMLKGIFDGADNMKEYDGSYTSFYSSDQLVVNNEMPVQWSDFAYTYGSSGGTGSTQYNDGTYAYMNSASYGTETYLGYIRPDESDLISNWNEGDGTPHYNKLDEWPDSDGDGGNIRESTAGVDDRWNFETLTLPANAKVTKLVVNMYVKHGLTAEPKTTVSFTSNVGASGKFSGGNNIYAWVSDTTTGLSLTQTQLNDLWINVEPYNYPTGTACWVDIETVYIQVYYTVFYYRHYSTITWDYSGIDLDYLDDFYYDYATTVAIDCDLDIYNWDTTGWLQLQSNTGTGYITGSYALTDPYISGTDQIKVRFETSGATTTDFDVRIDQLMFDYVLTTDGENQIEAVIDPGFINYNYPDLMGIEVESWHKTSVAQTITFSIYNYDTTNWETITSQSQTSFTQSLFQSTSVSDYFDDSGKMKIKYYGTSAVQVFNLYVDNLNITITYKMDLSHTITFYTNGLWKYRWEIYGSIEYTDWIYFEVIDPIPNFYAISESETTTRWIMQNATLTPVEDFHDDINTDYWNLEDGGSTSFTETTGLTDDCYATDNSPTNPHDGTGLKISLSRYSKEYRIFVGIIESNYLTVNSSANTTLKLYQYFTAGANMYIRVNESGSFDETTLTWNNQPTADVYVDKTSVSTALGWKTIDMGNGFNTYYMLFGDTVDAYRTLWDKEKGSPYVPVVTNSLNKNYFGSGYTYMQTDITEEIALRSIDYTTHYNLSSGDYFEVDFQTNSDSLINLILLKDGGVNKTLILSPSGNTNFGKHIVKISVSELVEFDQLKISGTLEDNDNVKVYDVKTKKYTLTGDHADFLVGSKGYREIYLTPDVYNLRIEDYSSGLNLVNENITIPTTGVLDYAYIPIATKQCRITFFNPQDIPLAFTDYHVYVNRSLFGSYSPFTLLENIFSVDVDTMVYIEIKDRFNTLIRTYEKKITPTTDYLDIELEVYSLQIKNLMEQKTMLDINGTYTYPLLSGDSIYFILSEANYKIGYYDTKNVYKQFTIYLNYNQAYELNKSQPCFLIYADQQGNPLIFENYKTYLNGSRIYTSLFYREIGDVIGIEIKDRYDISIKNDTLTVVSGVNEKYVVLTMYSLKVMNQQEVFNHINITRDSNYYDSEMYWSEWMAPSEIIEFKLFAGFYVINLTNNEGGGSSSYEYELNGDDVILISSGNLLSQVIYNIANVNTTIGNQITAVYINITNQNSNINNTIVSIDINIESMNSTLGNLLTDIDLNIININNNISNLYTFTENNFLNLGNNINNSFTLIENNIIAINQTISTLVIGLDGKVTIVNATITTMFTEMNSQFVVVQSTLDFSFAFLNQTIIQIGNNITTNQVALNNLIIQRANEIDNSLIQISTLVNLINSSVVNESLVIQSLVNIIGNNITENHVIINDLINLIGNNITENNINMVSIIELVGNNITTNHFVIQTLIDYVSNNITDNHLEFLTNINLINNTIGQNQIELINRLLFINNSINTMALDLTNQILLVNNTIYSAILDVSVSIDFNSDNILGNISLTYEQNDFLTNLYKETMFSQLINWTDVAFNYSLIEDRIDVWTFINDYKNESITVLLRYNEIIDNLTISAQNTIEQFLPNEDVEYRLWSIVNEEYLNDWVALPENRTVNFGFYEEIVPEIPDFDLDDTWLLIILIITLFVCIIGVISVIVVKLSKRNKSNKNKLYKYISKGRDSEADYYGDSPNPF